MNSSTYPKFIPRARTLYISQVRDKPRITLYRANVPKRKRQWYLVAAVLYIDLTARGDYMGSSCNLQIDRF